MEMSRRTLVVIALSVAAYPDATAVPDEPVTAQLPATLQQLRDETKYDSWDKYKFFSRTLKHHRTVLVDEKWDLVVSESGKSADHVDFVEVIKAPSESNDAQFAIYDFQTGKRLAKYPEGVTFPIEGAPDGSKESTPTVCIWCHHQQQPFVSVIPFDQSIQDSMDRARNRIGIRQSLADVIPDTRESRQRMEELNQKMEKSFPGRYSDMRVWLQAAIKARD